MYMGKMFFGSVAEHGRGMKPLKTWTVNFRILFLEKRRLCLCRRSLVHKRTRLDMEEAL